MFDLITGVAGLLGLSAQQLSKLYKEYRARYQDSKSAMLLKARQLAGERIANEGLLKLATKHYYNSRGFKEAGLREYNINPSCDLPKEIDRASEHKESDFDGKASGGHSMNGFW